MDKLKKSIAALSLLSATSFASAAPIPIDLSSWESDGQGTWGVEGVGNDSVFQAQNGQPTVFFEDGSNAQNTSIAGSISVESSFDNDFIGFVLGYQNDELLDANSEYILIDWKQADQGNASVGMAISLVQGATSASNFWNHDGGVTEIARASTLGPVGWNDFQSYDFDIVFTSSLIEVTVDNVLQLSITAADAGLNAFSDGAAGFYNYSQANVRYAGLTEQIVNPPPPPQSVPAPAMLGLALLGGIASMRSRRRDKSFHQ